mgnify:CR=1 FL=1
MSVFTIKKTRNQFSFGFIGYNQDRLLLSNRKQPLKTKNNKILYVKAE